MSNKRVYTQTHGVVAAIIESEGKILLVQENAPGEPSHELWNQPAGWIDVGEDPIIACSREVKEETGLDFKPTGLIGIFSLVKPKLSEKLGGLPHSIKLVFRGEITGGSLMSPNEEIMDLKWFTPADIYKLSSPPLRDEDISREVRAYFTNQYIDLSFIHHLIQKS